MAVPTLVQHVSLSNGLGQTLTLTTGELRIFLPDGAQAGNTLILGFQAGLGVEPTATVSDDGGNTWTAVASGHVYDATNQQKIWLFYALNVAANTRRIKVKNTTNQTVSFISAALSEFCNVANQAPETSNANNPATSTTVTAGSITPTTTGDLLYQYTVRDNPVHMADTKNWVVGSQANITWQLASADRHDGQCVQYGVYNSVSAINPTLTMGDTAVYLSAVVAFKSASAGSPRSTDMRIAAIHHISQPSAGTAMPFAVGVDNPSHVQVPCVGNLLVAMYSVGISTFNITGITDNHGNVWEQFGAGISNGSGQDTCQCWYAANLAPASDLLLAVTYGAVTTNDATLMIYDISGAAIDQNDIEVNAAATGDQTVGAATISTTTLTPGQPNGLALFIVQQEFNTENGLTLSGGLFDSAEFDGMNVDGPQNMDQNGGWAHYYNGTSLTPVTIVWNLVNTSTDPMRQWASYAVFFNKPPGPTGTARELAPQQRRP